MKDTVVKINSLRGCVHTTKLKLHGDGTGIDGLASIRRSLRLVKGHKVTPQMFYINLHLASFNRLKPVIFVDDSMRITWTLLGIKDASLRIFGSAIICLKDRNTGRLVGMNKEQVADMMSVITIKDGGVDTNKK
jgi:hypothetical protein